MKHFVDVIDAYNKKSQLITASGKPLGKKQVGELYERLTHDCWMWLNAGFPKGKGFLDLDLETIAGIDAKGELIKTTAPLEACLKQDVYVALDFNKQGLAKSAHSAQEYKQGENIKFWYPRQNAVAGFDADSGRANLGCSRDPDSRFASLGVRVVRKKI